MTPRRAALWILVSTSTLLLRDAQALPLTPIACSCQVDGILTASPVAVSPDGKHAYFGVFDGVVGRERDATTGTFGDELIAPPLPFIPLGSAFSPDGRHLYVVGDDGTGRIVALARTFAVGALAIAQTVEDGENAVDGLAGVRDVVVSPDGRHVYAVATQDHSIVAFARDALTGALAFVEVERNAVNGVDGMSGARALAISPDGRHLYVASIIDDSVAVFARDAVTGLLAFVEDRRDGVAGFDGLAGAIDVVVSRDGRGVFVLGALEDAIAVLSRNAVSGSLAFVEAERNGVAGVSNFGNPRALALDPLRPRLFAASIDDGPTPGSLQIFDYDASTGLLVRSFFLAGDGGQDLAVSPDGRHLYPVGATGGSVPPVAIAPLRYATRVREGQNGVTGLAFPTNLAAFGSSLYAISSFPSSTAAFTRSGSTLDFVGASIAGEGGVEGIAQPSGVAASADGRHLYVTGDQDDAIARFSRNAATGALAFAGAIYDTDLATDGLDGAQGVAVSADGAHVYVAASGDDSVAHFARNAQTGALAFVAVHRDGEGIVDGLLSAHAIALGPDEQNLYVTGAADDAIAVFSRNTTTGAIGFVEFEQNGTGGVTNMDNPYALAVSPDGRHVYVAARDSGAVVIFGRAPANGSLTFLGAVQDPTNLDRTNDVAVSPDGKLVFAIGGDASTLVAHWRDPETGALGLAQTETDNVGLVDGLHAASSLLALRDRLYVTSLTDQAIAIFVPEPSSLAAGIAALAALGMRRWWAPRR